jgi:predicted nuclease with TOPRIM domain
MAPAQAALHDLRDTIKTNVVPVIALVVAGGLLFVAYLSTRLMQPAPDQLDTAVAPALERAQRHLKAYEPIGVDVLALLAPASDSEPLPTVPENEWPASLAEASEVARTHDSQLRRLRSEFAELGIDFDTPRVQLNPTQTAERIKKNQKHLDHAIDAVSEALNLSVEGSEGTLRGTDHPAVTRLAAMAYVLKGDHLRRQAFLVAHEAARPSDRFRELCSQWILLNAEIEAIDADIQASLPDESGMETPSGDDEPAAETVETDEDDQAPAAGAETGLLGRLLSRTLSGDADADETDQGDDADQGEGITLEPPVEFEAPKTPATPQLTVGQELASLQSQRSETLDKIEEAKANVDELQSQVNDYERQLESLQEAAMQAQERMLDLEDQGVDPVEPGAMEAFEKAYTSASQEYRQAMIQINALKQGTLANARIDTNDQQLLQSAPVVPADPDKPIRQQRGLVVLKPALEAAQTRHSRLTDKLETIDEQIEELNSRREALVAKKETLRQQQQSVHDRAIQAMAESASIYAQADQLLSEALQVLVGKGQPTAQQAQRAAESVLREVRTQRSAMPPGKTDERLDFLSGTGFLIGHATSISGDVQFMLAQVQTQRHAEWKQLADLLTEAARIKITPAEIQSAAQDRKLPEPAVDAELASENVIKARENAVTFAQKALQTYRDAEDDLDRLWLLRASEAAVQLLLANLYEGPQQQEYLDKALATYQQAIEGREDWPSAQRFRRIVEELSAAG